MNEVENILAKGELAPYESNLYFCNKVVNSCLLQMLYRSPHTAKQNILVKIWKTSYNENVITEKELKTLWQKEKLLIMSNFSISYNVFFKICQLQKASTCGKGLMPYLHVKKGLQT